MVSLSTDPTAPPVYLSEEDVRKQFPWDYAELTKRARARYCDFVENGKYHKLRKGLEVDSKFA